MTSPTRIHDAMSPRAVAPEFSVPPTMLDSVAPSGDRGGMVLGKGLKGEPLSVSILRPAPTRIAVVGGLYLARLTALRAIATGAWVIVATARDSAWRGLERAAGTGADGKPVPLVKIRRLVPVELPRPTEDGPLLVVHDGGSTPQELFPARSPWQTTMYVLPYLHPQAASTAGQADLVLIQRLAAAQAQVAGQIWRLPPNLTQQLTQIPDDQVIAFGRNLWTPLKLVTNAKERQILGPVRRGD
ncbi:MULTISPECIES: hypothetical protein [Sciscionella]|uniref:hypothetical protein n=1 Tax=Sciscionella TaxID=596495 RepID=UPI00037883F9|nr:MULTISPECIES: hypothetical protein [Sciscionella]